MYEKKDENISTDVLILNRLNILCECYDLKDGERFDDNSDLLEMFLSQDPEAYKDLTDYKELLGQALKKKLENIHTQSIYCANAISKKSFVDVNTNKYEWMYRKDYLAKIVDVLGSRKLLEFQTPKPVSFVTPHSPPSPTQPTQPVTSIEDAVDKLEVISNANKTRSNRPANTPENSHSQH